MSKRKGGGRSRTSKIVRGPSMGDSSDELEMALDQLSYQDDEEMDMPVLAGKKKRDVLKPESEARLRSRRL